MEGQSSQRQAWKAEDSLTRGISMARNKEPVKDE